MLNPDVIAAVKAAKFCRVVVYPAVRGWCGERGQLEVADELAALGHTDCMRWAGHWLGSRPASANLLGSNASGVALARGVCSGGQCAADLRGDAATRFAVDVTFEFNSLRRFFTQVRWNDGVGII